jgi:hypothetical protein
LSAATTPRGVYLWLVARTDGSHAKVVRAVNAKGAILSRFKDEDDDLLWGNVATWRLGNFPEQYEVTADADGIVVRELGNPRV